MYHQIFTSVKIASPMPARARKLRTDVPTDVPTPAMAAGSDSGTAGDAPTGFRKNRVNCGSSCDSRISVYVSSDIHIGQNRVANAGTRRKLRTDVPTDVPTPGYGSTVPTRNGGGSSSPWETHSGLCRFSGTGFRKIITFSTTGATQTPAGDRRLRSRAGAGTGYGTQATASRYLEEKNFSSNRPRRPFRGSAARPRPRPGDACRSIAPMTDVSQIGRNRIAVVGTPWNLRTDVPTDVPTPDYGRKKFSPRTDLDDRPRLGGKTSRPRPGVYVPVDSPEDRRFSHRSKSRRQCRHAHRNFARTFRRTFRRRLWRQGPTRYGGGCSYGISQKSGKLRE